MEGKPKRFLLMQIELESPLSPTKEDPTLGGNLTMKFIAHASMSFTNSVRGHKKGLSHGVTESESQSQLSSFGSGRSSRSFREWELPSALAKKGLSRKEARTWLAWILATSGGGQGGSGSC